MNERSVLAKSVIAVIVVLAMILSGAVVAVSDSVAESSRKASDQKDSSKQAGSESGTDSGSSGGGKGDANANPNDNANANGPDGRERRQDTDRPQVDHRPDVKNSPGNPVNEKPVPPVYIVPDADDEAAQNPVPNPHKAPSHGNSAAPGTDNEIQSSDNGQTAMSGSSDPTPASGDKQDNQPLTPVQWIAKTDMPTARGQAAVVGLTNGTIYVFGGFTDSGTTFTTVETYFPLTNKWLKDNNNGGPIKPPLQATRSAASAVGHNGKIYLFGGYDDASGELAYTMIYDVRNNSWSTGAPVPYGGWEMCAATAANGKMYVFGGEVSERFTRIYNPYANTWSFGTNLAEGCIGAEAVAANDGLIYVIGGENYTDGILSDVRAYDPSGDSWTDMTDLPTAKCQFAAALGADGRIYTLGGSDNAGNDNSPYYSMVEIYDPLDDSWTTGTGNLPSGRRECGAASVYTGKIYLFGGSNSGYHTNTWEYNPDLYFGDGWTISGVVSHKGQNITVDGDLIVPAGTKLTLDDCPATVNGNVYVNGKFSFKNEQIDPVDYIITGVQEFVNAAVLIQVGFIVRSTGYCWFNSSTWIANDAGGNVRFITEGRLWLQKTIAGTPTVFTSYNNNYAFIVNKTAMLRIYDSTIEYCGWTNTGAPYDETGLRIMSNDTDIRGNLFQDNYYGIYYYTVGSLTVMNNTFQRSSNQAIYVTITPQTTIYGSGTITIRNNTINTLSGGNDRIRFDIFPDAHALLWVNLTVIIDYNKYTVNNNNNYYIYVNIDGNADTASLNFKTSIFIRHNNITQSGSSGYRAIMVRNQNWLNSPDPAKYLNVDCTQDISYNNITSPYSFQRGIRTEDQVWSNRGNINYKMVRNINYNNITITDGNEGIYSEYYLQPQRGNITYSEQTNVNKNNITFMTGGGSRNGIYLTTSADAFDWHWVWLKYTCTRHVDNNRIAYRNGGNEGIHTYDNIRPYNATVWYNQNTYVRFNNITAIGGMITMGIYGYYNVYLQDRVNGKCFFNHNSYIDYNEMYLPASCSYGIYYYNYIYCDHAHQLIYYNETLSISHNRIITMSYAYWSAYGIYSYLYTSMQGGYSPLYVRTTKTVDYNTILETGNQGTIYGIYVDSDAYPYYGNCTFNETGSISHNIINYNSYLDYGIYYQTYIYYMDDIWMHWDVSSTVHVDYNNITMGNGGGSYGIYARQYLYPYYGNLTYNGVLTTSYNTIKSAVNGLNNDGIYCRLYLYYMGFDFDKLPHWTVTGKAVANYNYLYVSNANRGIYCRVRGEPYQGISDTKWTVDVSHNYIECPNTNTGIYAYSYYHSQQNSGNYYPHWSLVETMNVDYNTVNMNYGNYGIYVYKDYQPNSGNSTYTIDTSVSHNKVSFSDYPYSVGIYYNEYFNHMDAVWMTMKITTTLVMDYNEYTQMSDYDNIGIYSNTNIQPDCGNLTYTTTKSVSHNTVYTPNYLARGIDMDETIHNMAQWGNYFPHWTVSSTEKCDYNTVNIGNRAYMGISVNDIYQPYYGNSTINAVRSISHNTLTLGSWSDYVYCGIYHYAQVQFIPQPFLWSRLNYRQTIDFNRVAFDGTSYGCNGDAIISQTPAYSDSGRSWSDFTASISNNTVIAYNDAWVNEGIYYTASANPANDLLHFIVNVNFKVNDNRLKFGYNGGNYGIDVRTSIISNYNRCVFYYNQTGEVNRNNIVFNTDNGYRIPLYYTSNFGTTTSTIVPNDFRLRLTQSVSFNTAYVNTTSDLDCMLYYNVNCNMEFANMTASLKNAICNNYLSTTYYVEEMIDAELRFFRSESPGQPYYWKVDSATNIDSNTLVMQKGGSDGVYFYEDNQPCSGAGVLNSKNSISKNTIFWGSQWDPNGIFVGENSYAGSWGIASTSIVNATTDINSNTLIGSGNGYGIKVCGYSYSYAPGKTSFVNMKNLKISKNNIKNADNAIYVYTTTYNPYSNSYLSTVDMNLEVSGNTIFRCDGNVIDIYPYSYNYGGWTFTNITSLVSGNTFYGMNGDGNAVYYRPYAYVSDGTPGRTEIASDVDIINNMLYGNDTAAAGISLYFHSEVNWNSAKSIKMTGDTSCTGNTVKGFTDGGGIYTYAYPYSDSNWGGVWSLIDLIQYISGNTLESNDYGIYTYPYAVAWSGGTACAYVNSTIDNNPSIAWNSKGIYIVPGWLGSFPYPVSSAHVDISGNNIHDNYNDGIYFYGQNVGMSGTVTDNQIWRNGLGMDIYYTQPLTVSFNNFHNNSQYAVRLYYCVLPKVEQNRFIENGRNSYGALYLYECYWTTVYKNDIIYNLGYGVYLEYHSYAFFQDNRIAWNLDYGIYTNYDCLSELAVVDGAYCAKNDFVLWGNVTVYSGVLTLQNMYFSVCCHRHMEFSIEVQHDGEIDGNQARIQASWNYYAYKFEVYGKMTLLTSSVSYAYRLVIASNDVILDGTTVSYNYLDGVYFLNQKPTILNCYFEYNQYNGLLIESVSDYSISNSEFYGNFRGVSLLNCGGISLISCDINNNDFEGIYGEKSAFELVRCTVNGNIRGIYATQGTRVRAMETFIESNDDGVYADSSLVLILKDSRIQYNHVGIASFNNSIVRVNDSYMYNSGGGYFEFYMWDNGRVFTLDTYFTGLTYLEDMASLTVNWTLVVHVVDANDTDIPNAKVDVKDKSGYSVTNYTGATGYTWKIECTQYIERLSGIETRTPHYVVVTANLVRSRNVTMDQPMNITVYTNHLPVIDSTPNDWGTQGRPYIYQMDAWDEDNDPLSYSVSTMPSCSIAIDPKTGLIAWVPGSNDVGVFKVTITVNDTFNDVKQEYYLTIDNINDNPAITDLKPTDITPGTPYTGIFNASDPDIWLGDNVNVSIISAPDGLLLLQKGNDVKNNVVNCELQWTPPYEGHFAVIVMAVDMYGASAVRTFMLGKGGDHAPYISGVSVSPDNGTVQTTFTATPSGMGDFDGNAVTPLYQWQYKTGNSWTPVKGATLKAFTPSTLTKGTVVRVTVTPHTSSPSNNGTPVSSAGITLKNSPPVVSRIAINSSSYPVTVDSFLAADFNASDPDGDLTVSEFVWLKNGEAIPGANGSSISALQFKKGDSVSVKVRVYDGTDYSGWATSAPVVIGNTAPTLFLGMALPPINGDTGTDFVFIVTYTDKDGDAPTSIVVLIENTSYEMKKRSGTPTTGAIYEYTTKLDEGSYTFHFEASDGTESVKTLGSDLKVSAAPIDWSFGIIVAVVAVLIVLVLVINYMMRKPKEPVAAESAESGDGQDEAESGDEDEDSGAKDGDDPEDGEPDEDEEPEYDIKSKKVRA